MKVNGFFKDISAFKQSISKRKERIINASPKPLRHDPIKALSRILHPENSVLVISSIINLSQNTKIIKFINKDQGIRFPVFQSGQYLSIKIEMENMYATRPYFIASAPFQALPKNNAENEQEPFIEIIVQKLENGLTSKYIWNNWMVGTEIQASFPHGKFFYEPLRDSENLVALVEGIGIYPFYSMIQEIYFNNMDCSLTIIYKETGINHSVLIDDLKNFVKKEPFKLKLIFLTDDDSFQNELNNMCEEKIKSSTFFICSTQELYKELYNSLSNLNVPKRRIRKQIYNNLLDNKDIDLKEKNYRIKIYENGEEKIINALSNETIMLAFEKAGIKKDTHCRSGECGYCRARIISGNINVNSLLDTKRVIDSEFGYFHPCVSYPASELVIDIMT